MIGLLVDCSIFLSVQSGLNNYYQICGKVLQYRGKIQQLTRTGLPLSELEVNGVATREHVISETEPRRLSEITLVRNRLFYARPSLTAKGRIRMGLKHIRMLISNSTIRAKANRLRCFQSLCSG